MSKKILVIAAHPDDEVLGCGATIAMHAKKGDEVHVVILAEGVTSRDDRRDPKGRKSELSELSKAAHSANKILGVKSLTLHDFPDNRMDSLDRLDVIKVVEQLIDKYCPETVYTHHAGDVNVDHRIIHEAVVTACRPIPSQPVKILLFFEIPSSTEWQTPCSAASFIPNWFVDVSSTMDAKLQALVAYNSEMRSWPHARSIEAVTHLVKWRGATVGSEAAEAFVLGRNLI
ncbi:MAG: GlcNAc-PI de-N-acetylase [Planctomycetes bacterium RBG_16_43_13]|nr:MAG: GlcNAc-PI de-N-acetylase [Planctomycetes bacterium RBG_16_43_13]